MWGPGIRRQRSPDSVMTLTAGKVKLPIQDSATTLTAGRLRTTRERERQLNQKKVLTINLTAGK